MNFNSSGVFDIVAFSLFACASFVTLTSTSYTVLSYVIPGSFPATSDILYLCVPTWLSSYSIPANDIVPSALFVTVWSTLSFSSFNSKLYFPSSSVFPSSTFLAPNVTLVFSAGMYSFINLFSLLG